MSEVKKKPLKQEKALRSKLAKLGACEKLTCIFYFIQC